MMQFGCSSSPTSTSQSTTVNQQKTQSSSVVGMPRSDFLAKVNGPASSRFLGDKRIDTFFFYQKGNMAKIFGQALFKGIVASYTPSDSSKKEKVSNSAVRGDKMAFEVTYDSLDRVEKIVRVQ